MSSPRVETISVGDWQVVAIEERRFGMDGGSMFGVVPRLLWSRKITPDEENRVPMRANIFLVRTGDANVLLDSGLGNCLAPMDRKIYAPLGESTLEDSLAALGLSVDEITHVILTHLHTDHSNGVFAGHPDRPDLRFPRAQHFVQSDEWDDAMHPDERSAPVYHIERFTRLMDSGRLTLLQGDQQVMHGISVAKTGGHTRGHQGVRVTSADDRFFYYADIVPTRFHLKEPWVSALDLYPVDTMKAKRALLSECCDTDTVLGICHDTEVMMARIVRHEKRMDAAPVDSVPVPVVR